jgi:uncharacterized protein (DUF2252 family)
MAATDTADPAAPPRHAPAAKAPSPLLHAFAQPLLSVTERMNAGKALRKTMPRAELGRFKSSSKDRSVVAVLRAQAATRVPDLVPIRHARMLASPFSFLRGAAAIMAGDLAAAPTTGLEVQACGDCHVSNFGAYASAERNLVFGINDFDETQPGPWEWDLKRLAASAVVVMRYLGGDRAEQCAAAHRATTSYRDRMRTYAQMGNLAVWYSAVDGNVLFDTMSPEMRRRAEEVMDKARTRGLVQVLDRMTELVGDRQRLIENAPLVVRLSATESGRPIADAVHLLLHAYLESLPPERRILLARYRVADVAQKVVGVGSVGTHCWLIYMQGSSRDDPLFLQVKQAQESVLAPYSPIRSPYANEGLRVVVGQRLLQGSPDIFLGWGTLDGVNFYVRQLRDMKGGADFEPGKSRPANVIAYCGICGWALALAHAKSGDAARLAGYMGKSDEIADAMVRFGEAYADQTEIDRDIMADAVRRGELPVA